MKITSRVGAFALAAVAIVILIAPAKASEVPADSNAGLIPNIAVWDEAGQQTSLWAAVQQAGGGPVVVLPVYTRCATTCPVLVQKLKHEASLFNASDFRVVLVSFDSSETESSLRIFREREKIPSGWILARTNDSEIRRFRDYFRYSVVTDGSVLDHPDETFLLDRNLRWRATLVGEGWDATELRSWLTQLQSPGLTGWLALNRERVAWLGLCGLSVGLLLIIGLVARRARKQSLTATVTNAPIE